MLYARLYSEQMIEALVAFGRLWSLVGRQHTDKLGSQHIGIHHLSLGISRMHAHSLDVHLCRSSIEVLVFEVAEVAAVHGISPLASELLHIKVVCSHTDFLVRVEAHAYVTVLYLVVVAQPAHGLHYFRNTCLVVSTEQSMTVCHDKVLSLVC